MIRCPLENVEEEDLYQGVRSLLPKCEAAKCTYHRSNLDSDRLPGGCILMVVAMLDKERTAKSG